MSIEKRLYFMSYQQTFESGVAVEFEGKSQYPIDQGRIPSRITLRQLILRQILRKLTSCKDQSWPLT